MEDASRIRRASGSPRAIGLQLGRMIGKRLERTIAAYIHEGPARFGVVNWSKLRHGARPWLDTLPDRFVNEMEGLAEGSGVPLPRIAEWTFVESCASFGCSSILIEHQDKTWIARNNDLWAPELWGFATIRDIEDNHRLPTLLFGMEGETFSATGVNKERLWLHCHFLAPRDHPAANRPTQLFFVWLTEALETCARVRDVEYRLNAIQRNAAMLLFAVDGNTNERAVFECECGSHHRLPDPNPWIAGTNHRRTEAMPDLGSQSRLNTLNNKAASLNQQEGSVTEQLIGLLADPGVEQQASGYGTVYAVVACPESGELHYTFGGFPAASRGRWQKLAWPWESSRSSLAERGRVQAPLSGVG